MTKYAKTYAGALYDLAVEENAASEIMKDLSMVCDALREMPEYSKLLSTPAVPKEERKALLKEAWQGHISQYTMNFLCMLCDGGTIPEIFNCEEEFRDRLNKDLGITEVVVTSAVALTDSQKSALTAAVEKKTGKKVILTEKVNPAVLGGLKLSVGGKQYDGTVSYHLGSIAQMLSGN